MSCLKKKKRCAVFFSSIGFNKHVCISERPRARERKYGDSARESEREGKRVGEREKEGARGRAKEREQEVCAFSVSKLRSSFTESYVMI